MSIRKIAGLLAGLGLMAGLIGAGVGAQFTASVTANQKINVGTFSCQIVAATPVGGSTVIAADGSSVTYTTPTIMSSVPSSAPFSFTVKNTGSIPQALTVASPSPVTAPWSIINAPFAPVPLAAGAQTTINTGVAWTELDNSDLNASGTFTWTVTCNENLPTAIFDNTPAANGFYSKNLYYSESLGAQSETQFGTQVGFSGSARNLQTATVAMSSWACQSGGWNGNPGPCVTTPGATYSVPITFNIYAVGASNAVGALLATQTQTFTIPYRPSSDSTCPATGSQTPPGFAFRDSAGDCQNGLVSEITFTFPGVTLPNNVIFGIAYAPTGDAGSLNVMLYPSDADIPTATQPAVGSFPLPNDTYADHTSGSTFPFQLDADGGYGGIQPAVQITATY